MSGMAWRDGSLIVTPFTMVSFARNCGKMGVHTNGSERCANTNPEPDDPPRVSRKGANG